MVFGETDYTSYHAVRFFITKDQQPLVLKAKISGDTGAIATGAANLASSNGAVIIAPPATSETPVGENSFAQNETVITGTSAANATSAAVNTNAAPAQPPAANSSSPVMASFSAGMLQASTQPDAAIEQALQNFLQSGGSQATGTQYRYVKADLNGDGAVDALVEMNWCDKSGCVWLVLQGKDGQFQQVGRLEGFSGSVMVAPSAHNGWYDLLVPATEQANTFLTLEHDGTSYPARPVASNQPQPDPNSLLELRFAGDNWLTMP